MKIINLIKVPLQESKAIKYKEDADKIFKKFQSEYPVIIKDKRQKGIGYATGIYLNKENEEETVYNIRFYNDNGEPKYSYIEKESNLEFINEEE